MQLVSNLLTVLPNSGFIMRDAKGAAEGAKHSSSSEKAFTRPLMESATLRQRGSRQLDMSDLRVSAAYLLSRDNGFTARQ
jgi:hypothetical protein